jgi:hypothetical protein
VHKYFAFLLVLLTCFLFGHACADVPWQAGGESTGENLQISLVTIDPGDELTMWWGHTAIIVRDTLLDENRFYNYGLFSFEQENFIMNFIQGRLIFWVGAWDASRALYYYQSLNRSIRILHFNLSPEKKLEMAQFLAHNVLPDQREYLYDHYRDNCSTRVRDLIDKIVDGQFFEATQVPGRMTYRQHTRRHTYHSPFMDWILMFLMSDTIDEPIRKWDEMFLPTELERNLQSFHYFDENGRKIQLVNWTEYYFKAINRDPIPEKAPSHTLWFLTASLFLSMLIFLSVKIEKESNFFIGSIYMFFGLIFGILGLALFFLSQFTDHTVTYGNENLFYANPLTIFLVIIGIMLFRRRHNISGRVRGFIYLLAVIAWIGFLVKIVFGFYQDNWLIIATILPLLTTFAVYWLINFPLKSR